MRRKVKFVLRRLNYNGKYQSIDSFIADINNLNAKVFKNDENKVIAVKSIRNLRDSYVTPSYKVVVTSINVPYFKESLLHWMTNYISDFYKHWEIVKY